MHDGKRRRLIELGAVAVLTAALVAPGTALALGTFSDVPDTHVFATEIEWMADSGITSGCGNGEYCPGDSVTRGQMSAFMYRLATLQVVDAATAIAADHADEADHALEADQASTADDADLLEGKTTAEIAPKVSAEEDPPGAVMETNKGLVQVNEVTIVAPDDGVLVISGTAFVNPESTTTDFILQTRVNGALVGSPGWSAWFRPASDSQSFEMSYTVAEEVAAGTHVVTQLVGPQVGTTDFIHNHETLTVFFVPAGQAAFDIATSSGGTTITSETGLD